MWPRTCVRRSPHGFRSTAPRSSPSRSLSTEPGNGSCALRTARTWRRSTSRKRIGARCASRAKSVARSIAPSAIRARSASSGTSPRARSSDRSCWPATVSAIGLVPCRRTRRACPPARARSPMWFSWAWASRYIISTTCATRAPSPPTARGYPSRNGASPCPPPASCRRFRAGGTRPARCSRSRCMPSATSCATSWCRSTRNGRSVSCWMPAAPIRACPMRSASPSNM